MLPNDRPGLRERYPTKEFFRIRILPVRADVLKRLRRLHGKSDAGPAADVPAADGISLTDARGGCAPETQEERVI